MSDNRRNTIYDNEMYRPDVKEEFLSRFVDDSQTTYKRIFLKSYMYEKMLEKDLCDFTLPEIEQLLSALAPLTMAASRNNVNIINSYINWAIPNYTSRQTNVSPIETLKSNNQFLNKFTDKDIQLYVSKDELEDILKLCQNDQDSCIFLSLFDGITTKELCQMKKEDIKDGYVLLRNDEGELKLGEDNNPIKLEVSERTVEILNKAAEEKFYHVYYEEGKGKRVETFDIIENDYVIRPSKTKVKDILQPIKQHVITRRVNALCELAGKQHLTPKNIVRSGHIYYGFKIWDEAGRPNFSDGYLNTEMYHNICRKFNMKKVKMGNSYTYSTTALRQYININNIKFLYVD